MALPEIQNSIPEVRAPTSRVSPSQIAQPYEELSATLTKAGDVLMKDVAEPLAEKAGLQAVTRDANGDVQIQKAPIFGDAAASYGRAVKTAALADADGQARRDDIALREQHRDDPQGYLVAADAYKKEKAKQYTDLAGPEVGVALSRVIDSQTTQTYKGLLNEHEALTLKRNSASMVTGIQSASDDLTAMARGGVTQGPDWDAALAKVKALTAERVNNPRLAYPQVQADYDLQHLEGELKANGFLYHVDQTYKDAPTKAEGAKAAMDYAGQILTDPSLKLSQAQREHYYAKATSEIRANEALRRQDVSDARLSSQDIMLRSSWGDKISPQEVDASYNMHLNAGDQAGAARLLAHAARMPLGDAQGQRPIADQNRDLAALRGQAAAKSAYDFFTGRGYTPAQASGIVGNLIHESGLDPTAIGDAGTSGGLAQFHNERLTALKQFAAERNKPATDFGTQLEFIDKELHSSEGRAMGALQAATTPEDAAAAFVHYERPRGYDPNNPSASLGFGSRVAQAKAVFGGQGNIDTGTPASALWLQINRARTLDKSAWEQWKQIKEDYKSEGIRPPDKKVTDLLDSARLTGDHALLEDIGKSVDQVEAARQMSLQGLPMQESQIAELHRQGAEQGLQAGQQAVLKDLERRYAAITKGLDENPIATTVANFGSRFQTPPPLNLADDQQLASGLAQRGKIAQFAAQNWQRGAVPALDKADMAAVQGALATPDPAVKARIFQAITTALPEDVRGATLQKLGEKGPEQMVAAAAGGLMGSAPDVAQSILRGQQAIKADKGYLPEKAEKTSFDEDFAKALPVSTFTLAARTDPSGPMAIAKGAIEARYADLSAQANDTGGKHNKDRLTQAITDVTGGVLDHNGGKLIAPARGMSQGQFDGLLWGITPADLGNAPRVSNLGAADQAMNLNPQEKALYERHLSNLTGPGGVSNPNGSRSTLFNITAGIGGKTFVLPTVYDGKILPPQEAVARAQAEGLDKFPSYASQGEADARYKRLHDFMEKDTAAYLRPGPSAVTTLAGEPVTPRYLQTRAQLESVGDGRYFVRLGRDASRPVYAYQGANSEAPQKFILDLRGRAPGTPPINPGNAPVGNVP